MSSHDEINFLQIHLARRRSRNLFGRAAGWAMAWLTGLAWAGEGPSDWQSRVAALNAQPISFEQNLGQVDGNARFVARGPLYFFSIAPSEVTITVRKPGDSSPVRRGREFGGSAEISLNYRSVRLQFVGADPQAPVSGERELPGRVNYLLGNDPARWRTSVPTYERVRVTDLYPGINLVHYGNQERLEYDFEVSPGVDPSVIAIRYTGADGLAIDARGDLILRLESETIRQPKPIIYQEVRGQRKSVAGGYRLTDAQTVTFEIGSYNRRLPLVIDPVLSYSTYYGGNSDDTIWAMALDASGNIYLAGETMSVQLQTTGAFQTNLAGVVAGRGDAWVSKVNNLGSTRIYSTYLGGISYEAAFGLAVDEEGNAYVTGYTASTNFPVLNAIQPNLLGPIPTGFAEPRPDCFIAKLDPSGSNLVFSTFFGGTNTDVGGGIALDASTNIYVAGYTISTNFPVANTALTNYSGQEDGFVLKLDATGTNLVYSMFLGGAGRDYATDVAADAAGSALVIGYTTSTNFPVTNALQTRLNNTTNVSTANDVFVAKITPAEGALLYATYLGGTNDDFGNRCAVDAAGAVYVTGSTRSGNFPRTSTNLTANVISNATLADVFVAKLAATGTNLSYAALFGGSGNDEAWDVAVDATGQAHVVGSTTSTDFPTNATSGLLRGNNRGGTDAFVSTLDASGTNLVLSAYLGGAGQDIGYTVAVDPNGNSYLAGVTTSTDFPTLYPGLGNSSKGGKEAFLAKVVSEPILTIQPAGTNVILTWPGFIENLEFRLQSNANLTNSAGWAQVATIPPATNGVHSVSLPATNPASFFRLLFVP